MENVLPRLLVGSILLGSLLAQSELDSIRVTTVPIAAQGGSDRMETIGGVVKTTCRDCRLVVYALGDAWYVQPWANASFTEFDGAGKWGTGTHLGTEYAALLVPPRFSALVRTERLPEIGGQVLAFVRVAGRRANPEQQVTESESSQKLTFSGYEWTVKVSEGRVGPGPNVFSANNAWVDQKSQLHLKITKEGARWTCAEVIATKTGLGYGSTLISSKRLCSIFPGSYATAF